MNRRGLVLVIALALAGASFVAYFPSLEHGFVDFDDFVYVAQNEALAQGLSGELAWIWKPHAGSWVPLTWLSFALDYEIGGLDPRVYHRTNVLLHSLGVALLYLAMVALTRAPLRSGFVALVFALHPVHVESVAWVAERKDVLSGVFLGLCLGSYADYARRPFALRLALPVVVFFTLGLLAKSSLVMLPFVLLLLDFWPLERLRGARSARDLLLEKLPLLAISGVAAWLTTRAGLERTLAGDFANLPLVERGANALISLVQYLGLTFWPRDLAVLYPHPGYSVSLAGAAAAATLLVAITASVIVLRRSHPALLVGWGWFGLMLLPVLGLVHVGNQAMADRFLYLPQTGLAIAIAWAVPGRVAASPAGRTAVATVVALVALSMFGLTRAQLGVWRDTVTLFEHTVAVTDENAIARVTLGRALVRDGREREAAPHFEAAARIEPGWGVPQLAQARALEGLGDAAQARRFYELALEARPGWLVARLELARLELAAGEPERVLHLLGQLDSGTPGEQGAGHGLRAQAFIARGNLAAAEASYRRAAEHLPDSPEVSANLGLVLAAQRKPGPAGEQLARAHTAGYGTAETHYTAARLAFGDGREADGLEHLEAAVALRPRWVPALNDLAWRLAAPRDPARADPDRALELARRAATQTGRQSPEVLDTLATALASAGRLDRAAAVLDEAVALLRSADDRARRDELRVKRDRYLDQAADARRTHDVDRTVQ